VVCAHADYLAAIDGIRDQLTGVECFVALEGARDAGSITGDTCVAFTGFAKADIAETDLLTINYTSGTTARPKGS